jgi:hypothetical protein
VSILAPVGPKNPWFSRYFDRDGKIKIPPAENPRGLSAYEREMYEMTQALRARVPPELNTRIRKLPMELWDAAAAQEGY